MNYYLLYTTKKKDENQLVSYFELYWVSVMIFRGLRRLLFLPAAAAAACNLGELLTNVGGLWTLSERFFGFSC